MTPLFPASRAAEEFDQVLAGTADPAVVARYADLLETVAQLRSLPEVAPSPAFVGDLRTRLLEAAESESLQPSAPVVSLPEARARRRQRRVGTVAASLVVVGGSAGLAAAASGSLPGDTLYPLKRGIEQVTASVRTDAAGEGRALLGQAESRLSEVRALQERGRADPDAVAVTMGDFRDAADAGAEKLFASYAASGDREDITTVRDFTAEQMSQIDSLAAGADTVTSDLLLDAADALADIDEQARTLCSDCGPDAALVPPMALSADAVAASMQYLIVRPVAQARTDIEAAEAARLAALQSRAQEKADELPQLPTDGAGTATGLPDTSVDAARPLTSTVTVNGTVAPALPGGKAVDDLVSGVTGQVPVPGAPKGPLSDKPLPGTDPLDGAVDDLTDGLDDTTDGLLP